MARKFLYVIAAIIGIIVMIGGMWQMFGERLMRAALVPSEKFQPLQQKTDSIYADKAMWIARPDIADNPSTWLPRGASPLAAPKTRAAIFFIHPTSYLTRAHWNAPLDDKEANDRAALFVRGQASVFAASGDVWAPRYRQATFGAFLTSAPEREMALSAAYQDVTQAFDEFVKQAGNRPIILAGHSQGALHLTHLLKDRIAGTKLAKRVVAAYVIGWPVSVEADLPVLDLPECERADQRGCILSWQSFAEPADSSLVDTAFDQLPGLNGQSRKGTQMICTNPISGMRGGEVAATSNLGTVKPDTDLSGGQLVAGAVPARCAGRGILLIGNPPNMGPYVLPGNNYHVYDYSLFWANIRADALRRLNAR